MPRSPDDPLRSYRAKRDPARTPEPVPSGPPPPAKRRARTGPEPVFVVQEHHARALHWDFRLERDGVLVSWAVPKGLPPDRGVRRLAVQTEDHPLEYASFEGDIPAGEYGGGNVIAWDRGTYQCEKWSEREVAVVLHGGRVQGRYVLIHTGGKNWLVQRTDPAEEPRAPLPTHVAPMLAVSAPLPTGDGWAFEFKWDGLRAVSYVDGGRIRFVSRNDRDITVGYPDLRHVGEQLGSRDAVLDGEIVAFDESGRPSFGRLQTRMHVTDAAKAGRLAAEVPVAYLVFDVLFLDGQSLLDRPYHQRRQMLESLGLGGPGVAVPPSFTGDGADVLAAAAEQGLEGVLAKRLDSPYRAGRRSREWTKIKRLRTQEVVLVGWAPGQGRRHGTIGGLLMAVPGPDGLDYAGRVGTGLSDAMLSELLAVLAPLERDTPPLDGVPRAQTTGVHWVEPRLVGEVVFSERTADGRLRQPSWRGLRPDKDPGAVVVES